MNLFECYTIQIPVFSLVLKNGNVFNKAIKLLLVCYILKTYPVTRKWTIFILISIELSKGFNGIYIIFY